LNRVGRRGVRAGGLNRDGRQAFSASGTRRASMSEKPATGGDDRSAGLDLLPAVM